MPRSWVVPSLFTEIEAFNASHCPTWSQWLEQPAEHRALMMAYHRTKSLMETVEHQEQRQRSELRRLSSRG